LLNKHLKRVFVIVSGLLLVYAAVVLAIELRPRASLPTLAAQCELHIGTAVQSDLLEDDSYAELVEREFNLVTPEYEMKFDAIQPEPGEYNFESPDEIVEFAHSRDMLVRGHTLVWGEALPGWLVEGDYSREESIEILRDHIQTVVGHYRGDIAIWDVVNEAVREDGQLRWNYWMSHIGPDYIEMAFRWAHEADPDARLFYNDFDIYLADEKAEGIYDLLVDLKQNDVPIDGVGFQMHVGLERRPDQRQLAELVQRFEEAGFEVHITEMDVSLTRAGGSTEESLNAQAQIYRNVMEVCLEADTCDVFTVWGTADPYSFLRTSVSPAEQPLLFDDSYEPKEAYSQLHSLLARQRILCKIPWLRN